MNVCLLAYTFYDVDYRVRRYAEALVESGKNVDVIALKRKGEKSVRILNGVRIYRIQERNYDEKNPLSFLLKILFFFIKGTFFLCCRHLKKRYDIIHIHNVPDFLIFMGILPKMTGTKLILDIHDILPEFYCQKFKKGLDSFLAKALFIVEKLSCRFADHVIVSNDLWREKIIRRCNVFPKFCSTILNYPSADFINLPESNASHDNFTLIYPGTISDLHGLDVAVRALKIVKDRIPSIEFHIYGRSNNLSNKYSLMQLIKELDLQETVTVFEPVPSEEIGKILSEADIGIVPKRSGVFSSEAFSTKILEYMAAGLPVIASDTPIDRYYFDDSMIMFFEPENYRSLSECIYLIYMNSEKRRYLAKQGKQFAIENNWAVKKKTYLKIVDNLIA